jgi:hypothetical protein
VAFCGLMQRSSVGTITVRDGDGRHLVRHEQMEGSSVDETTRASFGATSDGDAGTVHGMLRTQLNRVRQQLP